MTSESAQAFRDLCTRHGLAITHQRQIIYEVMQSMDGHPSPEEVYLKVRELIPAVSLATVYKNIHIFLASGILREVSPHHGSLRVEMNSHPHHHLVCTSCRSIQDISESELIAFGGCRPIQQTLPGGFLAQKLSIDILGLCATCQGTAAGAAIQPRRASIELEHMS